MGYIHPDGPRCLHPMQSRSDNEPDPVCYRPQGHPRPDRHLSRRAYTKELERSRRRRGEYRQ